MSYQKVIAAGTLKILAVATATAQREAFARTDVAQVVEAAKRLLRARIDTPVMIEEIAKELSVGYCWFRRAFRQYTGLAPAQYQLQLRMNFASELLRNTTLTVAAVAERTGFESDNYFFRIFKKRMGSTPGEYRALFQRGRDAPGATSPSDFLQSRTEHHPNGSL